MAKQPQQPAEGLSPAEQQIADMAEIFVVRGLERGRFQKRMYRSFPEAFTAAAMNPDKKASIAAVDADNQSVAIPRSEWARWLSALKPEDQAG